MKTVKRSPNPASWFTCCKRCRLRRDKITLNTICKTISSYNLRLLYLLQLLSKINQPLQNIVILVYNTADNRSIKHHTKSTTETDQARYKKVKNTKQKNIQLFILLLVFAISYRTVALRKK